MEKFWQWMVKNKYGQIDKYCNFIKCTNGSLVMPTNKMLIGYMIEYLFYVRTDKYIDPTWEDDIDSYYTQLEYIINIRGNDI